MINKFGRKAIFAVLVWAAPFAVATAALFVGKMTAQEWTSFCEISTAAVFGMFATSNVASKFSPVSRTIAERKQ